MQEKYIKHLVKKQLGQGYPNWNRLSRKQKKKIAEEISQLVVSEYNAGNLKDVPIHELTGTFAIPKGIIPLSKMGEYVKEVRGNLFSLPKHRAKKQIKDAELPPSSKVNSPENVDEETGAVFLNEYCENPMEYAGRTETGHEFKCGAAPYECSYSENCAQRREIAFDGGFFGQIPCQVRGVEKAFDLRKHIERGYNLLKHCDGIEPNRVRSQQGLMVTSTIAHAARMLLQIVGTRKTKEKKGTTREKFNFAA